MQSESALRLVWIYPDLLSTYGDQGNVLVLEHRARARGIPVETLHVRSADPVPESGDIYLLGGGEDRPQMLGAERLRRDGGLLRAADGGPWCSRSAPATSSSAGSSAATRASRCRASACSTSPASAARSARWASSPPRWTRRSACPPSPGSRTTWASPGSGRGSGRCPAPSSGWATATAPRARYAGRVVGTYLHGPALARNPALADLLLRWVVGDVPPIDDTWYEHLRKERLDTVLSR